MSLDAAMPQTIVVASDALTRALSESEIHLIERRRREWASSSGERR
jgi:hypothetical protein